MNGFLVIQDWSVGSSVFWTASFERDIRSASRTALRMAGEKPGADTFVIPMSEIITLKKRRAVARVEHE